MAAKKRKRHKKRCQGHENGVEPRENGVGPVVDANDARARLPAHDFFDAKSFIKFARAATPSTGMAL